MSQVPVTETPFVVGRVIRDPKLVVMLVGSDAEGKPTSTPAPTVTDAATVAETLTLIGGTPDNTDETPLPRAAGT